MGKLKFFPSCYVTADILTNLLQEYFLIGLNETNEMYANRTIFAGFDGNKMVKIEKIIIKFISTETI